MTEEKSLSGTKQNISSFSPLADLVPMTKNQVMDLAMDMGKILPDGNLLFVNRKDWMLKVHGQRVEPGEIEACMNETEGVSASVVRGFEQEDGSMLLCGFYTGDASRDSIRARLEEKLPRYMVPAVLVRLDRFPVNPNGKVDRMALEKPDQETRTGACAERTRGSAVLIVKFSRFRVIDGLAVTQDAGCGISYRIWHRASTPILRK